MKDKGDLEDGFWLGDFMNYIGQKIVEFNEKGVFDNDESQLQSSLN